MSKSTPKLRNGSPRVVLVAIALVAIAVVVLIQTRLHGQLYVVGMVRRGETLREPLTPAPQQTRDGFFHVAEDVSLFYSTLGVGTDALVVHGGPCVVSAQPWHATLPPPYPLRFVFYHQRGCGWSSPMVHPPTDKSVAINTRGLNRQLGLAAQISDIERIRALLKQERLLLVGEGFGALLAALYAAELPQRVSALVLINPSNDWVTVGQPRGLWSHLKHLGGRRYAPLVMTPKLTGVEHASDRLMPLAVSLSLERRHDYSRALRAVKAPVLIVTTDPKRRDDSEAFAAHFPDVRRASLSACRASVLDEQPDELARVVAEFLRL